MNYSFDPTNPYPKNILSPVIIPLNAGYPNSLFATTTLANPLRGLWAISIISILEIIYPGNSPKWTKPTALAYSYAVNEK